MSHDRVYDRKSGVDSSGRHVSLPHPDNFIDDFRDACIRRAVGPVAADAIVENANMIATLTRCQEECTNLVQEKRNLERLLLREQEMHNKTVDRLEKKFDELESTRAELDRVKTELASVKKGRDDDEKSFELRCDADLRAIKMWQAAHPDRKDVWPDHADNMVVWLLERLKSLKTAVTVLADTYVNHAELCRHNAGDLCDCNYHDMKRMWSTITGMDIRI